MPRASLKHNWWNSGREVAGLCLAIDLQPNVIYRATFRLLERSLIESFHLSGKYFGIAKY